MNKIKENKRRVEQEDQGREPVVLVLREGDRGTGERGELVGDR